MELTIQGVLIGVIATIGMDIWAVIVKNVLRLPTADWALVGRWFGYMTKGVFVHRPISGSTPISNELIIGWVAHYLTGLIYGLVYLYVTRFFFQSHHTLKSALIFGLATLVAPWLVMQPAMGAGVFARLTPRPGVMRTVNVSMHLIFGGSLYIGWLLIH
jgi:hypothetical protein